jgi:hypothetical protein
LTFTKPRNAYALGQRNYTSLMLPQANQDQVYIASNSCENLEK